MTPRKVFRCVVDDTVLITNISEIKKWVSNGSITLTIPIYTLERLALLKHDASQIGINARHTVEFLDRVTEGKHGIPLSAISLQGPTDRYQKWADVEKHVLAEENQVENMADENTQPDNLQSSSTNPLSQMLLNKLNFAKEADVTPPSSACSSNDRSGKTSPEMMTAKLNSIIVPHSLKPLVNAVVWQANEGEKPPLETFFISNSADAASLMRYFGVSTKNVHQLRQAIGLEAQEIRNQSIYLQKHPSPPKTATVGEEPKAMFKYEEESDEEVVFKPRGRGGPLSASNSPVMHPSPPRPSSSHRCSPRMAHSHPRQAKPEIPTKEIDPDSFDRGGFGRANGQRLVLNDANTTQNRAPFRGGFTSGPSRSFHRGPPRGSDKGSMRGRGRLFVP